MEVELTLFKNLFDNSTKKSMRFDSFSDFEKLLYSLSEKPGYKPAKGEPYTPKASPLISPATYKPGTTRANANVIEWAGWAALDIDEYEDDFEKIMSSFGDSYFVCYSTASSSKEHPKFRLVFPLKSQVEADKIKHFWFALNKEYLGLGDAQTKDLSRMYYIPATYPDAYNFIFTRKGDYLDPDELMSKYEYVPPSSNFIDNLPEGLKNEIINQRKAALTNDSYSWTSYSDCPFVRDNLVMEYSSLTDGRYRKLYNIMCSIAAIAIRKGYPLTASELEQLARGIDRDHQSNRFKNRDLNKEANRALEFVYKSI